MGDEILPSYVMDYFINHDKDPYSPTSIMESSVFFRGSTESLGCMLVHFSAEITSLNTRPFSFAIIILLIKEIPNKDSAKTL